MSNYLGLTSDSLMEMVNDAASSVSGTYQSVAESFQTQCQSMAERILSYKYQEKSITNRPDFPDTLQPVWLLGNQYSAKHDLEDLQELVRTRLWFTYRRGFPSIGSSGLTSDQGWGCMLRCGQMVLGSALIDQRLGKSWRWTRTSFEDEEYRRILEKFQDNKSAPFSIHQISLMGESVENKPVGTWFGPNTVAQVLRKLLQFDPDNRLVIHVAMDNALIVSEVKEACSRPSQEDGKSWQPLLLFISLRLGLSEINPVYWEEFKTCFTLPQTLGVIGGRPNHALYMIGCVEDEVIYLDPHVTQDVVDVNSWEQLLLKVAADGARSEEAKTNGTCDKSNAEADLSSAQAAASADVEPASEPVLNAATSEGSDRGNPDEKSVEDRKKEDPTQKDEDAQTTEANEDAKKDKDTVTEDMKENDAGAATSEDAVKGGEEAHADEDMEKVTLARSELERQDSTFHAMKPGRIHISQLDPSMSLCFLCRTEEEFDNLFTDIREKLIRNKKNPLFELFMERPDHLNPNYSCDIPTQPEEATGENCCDEDFEILTNRLSGRKT